MICTQCGNDNRPGARFCTRCGALLEEGAPPIQAAPQQPSPAQAAGSPADTTQVVGKVGLFGGNGIVTVGALIVLIGFILPWASCGYMRLSGLDIATNPSDYGGSASWTLLLLLPLGALLLMGLSVAGIVLALLGKKLPPTLARLTPFWPLLTIVPGLLCGCCPSCAFFWNAQRAASDPENLGLIRIEYGFWVTVFGLLVTFAGIAIALAGGLVAQRRAASTGPPS